MLKPEDRNIQPDDKSYRRRSGILVKSETTAILIDASPDVREHFLRNNLLAKDIDAILITHAHYDHIMGLGEFIRIGKKMPLYAEKTTLEEINKRFGYLPKYDEVYIEEITISKPFAIGDLKIIPIELNHPPNSCTGYKITNNNKTVIIATDTKTNLPEKTKEEIKQTDVLIIDAIAESPEQVIEFYKTLGIERDPDSLPHGYISQVQQLAEELKPKKVVCTHFCHLVPRHEKLVEKYETETFLIGYDGMKIIL